jgi:hypothetical protein
MASAVNLDQAEAESTWDREHQTESTREQFENRNQKPNLQKILG